eukprot:208405-Ditylum_brightwellii.AAC.1
MNFYYTAPVATKGSASVNLKHKGGHNKGVTPQNQRWRSHFAPFCATPGFGGEGHQPVLHVDKGNATCFLKGFNKARHCFYIN